ncbi:MAG: hypothetical protein FJ304_07230 [Planctomycetes bacterium]|nr:hypothetical protein [Planctomycetota bacterium]
MFRYLFGALVLLAPACALGAEKELHVVGLYEGHGAPRDRSAPGKAAVTVDRPGKEVVLVVSTYNPVTWEVRATPKTAVKKVIAVGYHRQSVVAPNGVEVEELTSDRKNHIYIDGCYDIENQRFRTFVRRLAEYTGLEVLSFQGTYQFDPKKPFVVDGIQKDERLSLDFPKLTPAAQAPKIKFEATRVRFPAHSGSTAAFGGFTESGPAFEVLTPLPKGILQLVYDSNGKQHFGLTLHELHAVSTKEATSTKLAPPPGIEFHWPRAATFDAKRNRVLICAHRGLFEYAPASPLPWTQLTEGRLSNCAALVWQAKTDTLFSFGAARNQRGNGNLVPTLYQHNANGTVTNSVVLGTPLFPGVMGEYGLENRAELIDLGGDLALLIQGRGRDTNTGEAGKPEAFLYVIDPKTGKVKLAWKE